MANFAPIYERNQEATLYIGNCDQRVNEEILWELFLQCGPVVSVQMPRDKITTDHQGYGFVEFKSEEDADYAIKIMHMTKLYGKPIKVNKASHDKRTQEVGANIWVGNLDPDVDEKMLFDTFNAFGLILSTKISRDPETGESKGHGFVSYDSFESADAAIKAMDKQYFSNRTIKVEYAFKKDTKGQRHGSAAERLLAANRPIVTRAGLFGNNESNLNKKNTSLILPSSLITSHNSHLLSTETATIEVDGLNKASVGEENIPKGEKAKIKLIKKSDKPSELRGPRQAHFNSVIPAPDFNPGEKGHGSGNETRDKNGGSGGRGVDQKGVSAGNVVARPPVVPPGPAGLQAPPGLPGLPQIPPQAGQLPPQSKLKTKSIIPHFS